MGNKTKVKKPETKHRRAIITIAEALGISTEKAERVLKHNVHKVRRTS